MGGALCMRKADLDSMWGGHDPCLATLVTTGCCYSCAKLRGGVNVHDQRGSTGAGSINVAGAHLRCKPKASSPDSPETVTLDFTQQTCITQELKRLFS